MTIKVKIKSKIKQKTGKAVDIYEDNTLRHLDRVSNMFKNFIIKSIL